MRGATVSFGPRGNDDPRTESRQAVKEKVPYDLGAQS